MIGQFALLVTINACLKVPGSKMYLFVVAMTMVTLKRYDIVHQELTIDKESLVNWQDGTKILQFDDHVPHVVL